MLDEEHHYSSVGGGNLDAQWLGWGLRFPLALRESPVKKTQQNLFGLFIFYLNGQEPPC